MTNSNTFQPRLTNDLSFTILDGETESSVIDCHGTSIVGLIIPSGFEGTTLTVKVSDDNDTFYDYYDTDNNQVELTVAASRAIGIVPTDFAGFRYIKFVAGTSQTGDIEIIIKSRPL